MTFLSWNSIRSQLGTISGGVVAYILVVLMIAGIFAIPLVAMKLLTGCSTQNAWRTQATSRYCNPVEIEDTGSETWRALCSDERIFQCSRDATQPSATYCTEVR